MNLLATLVSLFTLVLLLILIVQMRNQRQATCELLSDSRIRTRLYEDADESTSLILSRTIRNISEGKPDVSLESDAFAMKVVRELVKRKVPKDKWLEIQSNERLVHELFLLLRDGDDKKKTCPGDRSMPEERGPEPRREGGRDPGSGESPG